MVLDLSKTRHAITERRKAATISRAIAHQNRLKFHVQTHVTPFISQPTTDFLAWVERLIPNDKFKIFKSLFRYPVITNEVTGIVFDKLSRVFDGRNPALNYQFMSSEQRDDWEYYRQEVLKEPTIWQTKGWEYFQTEINSVLIVDLPTEQKPGTKYPEPYFYWLTIDQIIAYDVNPATGFMEYIIFRQPDNRIAVIDDEFYRVYSEDKDHNIGSLLVESKHDLGYTPARFFWNVPLSISDPDIKASPLTRELETLDWYLFFHISKRHLDLYGAYPIYSGYEQNCDYSNSETGDMCDGGFLKDRNGNYKFDSSGLLLRCPKCGDKRIAGVGSFVEVPIPGENQPDLRNPVQMLGVDTSSLEYNVKEVERLKENILRATVGVNDDFANTQAVNEKQVDAFFESQTTILTRIKKGFESAQQFIDETVCRLRYGNAFVSAKINLGTDFYVVTPTELRNKYKLAKESGASESELDALQNQIIETEYRHNPTQLQRMLILAELEPYRHLTRNEVINLYEKQIIPVEAMQVKLNFANFVRRFERENTNILEFGTLIPYDKKISIIADKLREYAKEVTPIKQNQNEN